MRLTNHSTTGFKPRFFLMANIHGRELITNETAMVFIQKLLQGYGNDPDITWLLDYDEIYVLVSANPDGHVKNEQEPIALLAEEHTSLWLLWRFTAWTSTETRISSGAEPGPAETPVPRPTTGLLRLRSQRHKSWKILCGLFSRPAWTCR